VENHWQSKPKKNLNETVQELKERERERKEREREKEISLDTCTNVTM